MLTSIIIPCFNSAATIGRAVDSVFCQTWKEWELILVNNNSTDDTLEILEDIKSNNPDKKITVLNEIKKGAPAARNKGLYVAKGEWIQFLDADDELLPEKLDAQINCIKTGIDAIYSPYYNITELGVPPNQQSIIKGDIWEALLRGRIGITSSNLFRKKALLSIGGWEETLSSSQDTTLAFNLLRNNSLFLPVDLLIANKYSLLNQSSITNTRDKEKIKSIINNYIGLRKDIMSFLNEEKRDERKYTDIFDRVFADVLLRYSLSSPLFTFFEYNTKTKHNIVNRLKVNYSFVVIFINKFLKLQ